MSCMLLATLRCIHPARVKWNHSSIRWYTTQQRPRKFFNFIIKPKDSQDNKQTPTKNTNTTPSYQHSTPSNYRPRFSPLPTKPLATFQPNSNVQVIPKTIDGVVIENKFTTKIPSWPFREAISIPVTSFNELGLHSDICAALEAKQITIPTPVQKSILYNMLLGEQILVRSQTGTGKTLAVVAGIMQQIRSFCTEEERRGKNVETEEKQGTEEAKKSNSKTKMRGMKVLVIVPTRELAWQITKWIIELENLGESHRHYVQLCAAGVEVPRMIANLRKHQPHVVVGTPKQLIQILHEAADALDFSDLRTLIVDEVDQIVQALGIYAPLREKENRRNHPSPGMALVSEIKQLAFTHAHQTILMSATLNSPTKLEIRKKNWTSHPVLVNSGTISVPSIISHHLVFAEDLGQTDEILLEMVEQEVKKNSSFRALVFIDPMSSTRDYAARITNLGIKTVDLSTALSFENPAETKKTFENFQKGEDVRLFITTEFTARGFDLPNMDTVFILGCFFKPKSYIHMAGRTGRMGNKGQVITIMPPDKIFKIRAIFKYLDIEFPANLKEEMDKIRAEVAAQQEQEKEIERDESEDIDEPEGGMQVKEETEQANNKPMEKKLLFKNKPA